MEFMTITIALPASVRSGLSTVWLDSTSEPPVMCAWPFGTPRSVGQTENRARYKHALASASPSSLSAATVRSQQSMRHPLSSYRALGYNLRERPVRKATTTATLSRKQAARRLQAAARDRYRLKTAASVTIQAEARRRRAAARARARLRTRRRFELRIRLRAVLFAAKLRHAARRRRLQRAAMLIPEPEAAPTPTPKKQESHLHTWAKQVADEERAAAAELALLIKRARPKKKPNPELKRFRPRISLMVE